MRCSGEFAPGEETLLGIEPGKFHQANLSIIDNLFTRPRLKLPKTRRKRQKALHRLYKQDRSKAAALIVSCGFQKNYLKMGLAPIFLERFSFILVTFI